jgi:hypothetical protein
MAENTPINFNLDDSEALVEKWDSVLECKGDFGFLAGKAKPLDDDKKALMAIACEQIEQSVKLQEKTQSSNVARYDPILIPVMRRVMPGLIANDIFGTQPMAAPTGLIFALRAAYQGPQNAALSQSLGYTGVAAGTATVNQIVIFNDDDVTGATISIGQTLYFSATTAASVGSANTLSAQGTVVHVETQLGKSYVLLKNTVAAGTGTSGVVAAGQYASASIGGATAFSGNLISTATVYTSYSNEMFFKTILQAYSGGSKSTSGYNPADWTTAEGFSTDINEVGFIVEKTSVSAISRKLKTRWTQELEEDLNAVHSINAEKVLQEIATEEITTGMNREMLAVLDAYAVQNALTTAANNWDYDDSDGRWEVERYMSLAIHISRIRRKLALENRRGQATFLIITTDLLPALEATGRFSSSGNDPYTNPFVGTFDGMKVYCDIFRFGNEISFGYKGPSQLDAGFFYCPYIPLKVQKGFGQEDNNPRLFFSTRYGVGENPWGAENYYCKFTVTATFGNAQTTAQWS